MKPILFLSFCLLACAEVQTSSDPESVERKEATKKIKRKITADHVYKTGDSCVGGIIHYNEIAQMIEEYDYSSCGILFKKVRYEYDQLGRIAISHIESELENVSYKWIYNAIGQLEEKVAFRPTTSFQYKLEYSYDSLGNQVEYRGTMADGTAYQGTSRKVYSYENGKKRSTQCYNGVNFDTKGYLIMHLYDDEGKEILNYIFKEPNSDQADTSYVYYEYYE